MVLVSTGLVKALPQATASHPTLIVSGAELDPKLRSGTGFNTVCNRHRPTQRHLTIPTNTNHPLFLIELTNHLVPDMVDALQLPKIGY